MDNVLQQKLFEKYPKIFAERTKSSQETCMCWGIDCGNGWYNLLDMLCGMLQWDTDKNGRPQVVAAQVKEKFGTLRFYTRGADERQQGQITFAEILSGQTCEECGTNQNVSQTTKGWVVTLCDKCMKEKTKG